jgi:GT2 family glycosyltransferase
MSHSAPPVIADLSVVVPTLGRPVLERCLDAIAAGSRWPARLVLLDQGRNPDVVAWVRRLRAGGLTVDHVRSDQRGVAAARNRGIELVSTPLVAINDDDQCVAVDWLHRMHERLLAHPDAIVTGRVAPAAPGVPSSISSVAPVTYTRPLLDRDPLFAGNMGLSLSTMERVGPFDEAASLNGAEDNDWGYRALRLGVPIVYAPEVAVTHLDWRDAHELDATYRRYARAQGGFYGKHLRRWDPFIAGRALRDVVRGPWLVLRAAVTRNPELAVIGRAETRGILPGIIAGFWDARQP